MFDFFKDRYSADGAAKIPLVAKLAPEISPHDGIKYALLKNNIRIAYTDEGQGDQILLFIHGIGSGMPVWSKNIAALRNKNRCITLDLPGHGFSSKGNFRYTIQFYKEVLLEFCGKLDLRQAIFIGHSMGAQIAVKAALESPQLCKRLILISPAGLEPYTLAERYLLTAYIQQISLWGLSLVFNHDSIVRGLCYNKGLASEL